MPTRRRLLQSAGLSTAAAAAVTAFPGLALAQEARPPAAPPPAAPAPGTQPAKAKKDKGPPIPYDLVRAFVGAGHADLAAVRQMLEERPNLINATWDWGGGDYETALGGASHMGRRDIAEHLVARGARLDLFAAAVLGQLEVLRAAVAAFPGIHRTLGPHGIPLLQHARNAEQAEVIRYLESLG